MAVGQRKTTHAVGRLLADSGRRTSSWSIRPDAVAACARPRRKTRLRSSEIFVRIHRTPHLRASAGLSNVRIGRLALLLAVILGPASLFAEEASYAKRAEALALRSDETPPESRELLTRLFRNADKIRAADTSRRRISWLAALRIAARKTEFRPEQVYWLASVALDPDATSRGYARATLGWVPGEDARVVLLALGGKDRRDPALHFALTVRVRTFAEERAALLAVAEGLPPGDAGRCALLHALVGEPEPSGRWDPVVLQDAEVQAITKTLEALSKQDPAPSPEAIVLCQSLWRAGKKDWGPPLARLVERHPESIRHLKRTLLVCEAPINRPFLWSRLGRGYADRNTVALLGRNLGSNDREHVLKALAPGRWHETGFYLRVEILRRAPMDLLDDTVHEALWTLAEAQGNSGGLNVARDMAVDVIARYQDPNDDQRLERLIVTGPQDASSEALRVLLRRSKDPAALFLSELDHENPVRRFIAATTLFVDFQASPKLPVPKTIDNWRKFGEVLQRRLFTEEDKWHETRTLEALRAVIMPSPRSPMRDRTVEDDRAFVAFCVELVKRRPGPSSKLRAMDLLYWTRASEALVLLDAWAKDDDPKVAGAAARTAKHVRLERGDS